MNQMLTQPMPHDDCPLAYPLNDLHDWLAQSVQWPTGMSLAHIKLHRLWPSPRKGVFFELSITLDTTTTPCEMTLQGGWLSEPPWDRPHRKAKLTADTLLGLRLHHKPLNLWVCSPDRDKQIRWSRHLFDPQELTKLMTAITPHAKTIRPNIDTPQPRQLSLRAYRVHRRCVAHVTSDSHNGSVFIKAFHRLPSGCNTETFSQLQQQLTHLSHDTIKLPPTLSIDQQRRIIVTSCVRNNAHQLQYNHNEITQAAQVLACLHACHASGINAKHSVLNEIGTVTRWPQILSLINAKIDQQWLTTVIKKLTAQMNHLSLDETVLIHRDFYHTQLLLHDQHLWLLDLDTLCTGHREVDLATFVAHLFLHCAQQKINQLEIMSLVDSFFFSYIEHGGQIDVMRLAFFLSCALTRLASIHAVRAQPAHTIQTIWVLANSIIDLATHVSCPSQLWRQALQQCDPPSCDQPTERRVL